MSRATSRPEFSCPGSSCACTKGPKRVSLTYHAPQRRSGNSTACAGQSLWHTPQPSQPSSSMEYTPSLNRTASKRHSSVQRPQAVHRSGSMRAVLPEIKTSSCCTCGFSRMCMSGTSTSRSQSTAFCPRAWASAANAAQTVVFPVPPLPLITTISRMAGPLGKVPHAASKFCKALPPFLPGRALRFRGRQAVGVGVGGLTLEGQFCQYG